MTSFKTTVVHRAQFDIVPQSGEHAKSLTKYTVLSPEHLAETPQL